MSHVNCCRKRGSARAGRPASQSVGPWPVAQRGTSRYMCTRTVRGEPSPVLAPHLCQQHEDAGRGVRGHVGPQPLEGDAVFAPPLRSHRVRLVQAAHFNQQHCVCEMGEIAGQCSCLGATHSRSCSSPLRGHRVNGGGPSRSNPAHLFRRSGPAEGSSSKGRGSKIASSEQACGERHLWRHPV